MLRLPLFTGAITAVLLSAGSVAHAQSVQYQVNYRTDAGWQTYGSFVSSANAEQLADTLSQQYPAVQIVPVGPPTPITTMPVPPADINPRYWPRGHWGYERGREYRGRDYDRERRERERDRERDRRFDLP